MPQVWRCQKSTLGPLELESQLVVSFLTWMLRYELGSSGRVARALNHLAINPGYHILTNQMEGYINHCLLYHRYDGQWTFYV